MENIMKQHAMTFAIAILVFLVVDATWLSTVGRSFYVPEMGALLRSRPIWSAAAVFYVIFILGLMLFVINPAIATGSIQQAIFMGAAFGLVSYATYDLTNYSTVEGFPLSVAIVDIAWGTVLAACVSGFTVWAVQRLNT
jgi:uncharacterized membrane protein